MKQFIFMLVIMAMGTVGAFHHVFWGLLLYYGLAVLRPQHLWAWALPEGWRWSLMAAGAVLIGVVVNLPTVAIRGRLNGVAVTLIVYSLLVLLSILNAVDPGVAQEWGVEFGKIAIVAIVASLVIDSIWQVDMLGRMILLTIGYIAWDVNSLYIFDGRLDIYRYGFGGLDNNGAGLVVAMGIPFAYAYGMSARNLLVRGGSWFLGLLMLHAMLMSYSRGAMLATLVGAVWLLLHHRPRYQAAAIAAAAALAVSILAGPEIRARFMTTGDYATDPSVNSRFESWGAAWAIAWDNPITGQGLRNSNMFTHNYGADVQGRTIHSQYLQVAADSGIPAMLSYITLVVMSIVSLGMARRECVLAGRRLRAEAGRIEDDAAYARRQGAPQADAAGRAATAATNTGDIDDAQADIAAEDAADAQALAETEADSPEWQKLPVDHRRADDLARLMLACQTSLIIFGLGGIFLSLEVFELPWLLVVMAGVAPAAIHRELLRQHGPRTEPPLPEESSKPDPRRGLEHTPIRRPIPAMPLARNDSDPAAPQSPSDPTGPRPAMAP
ncbi:MAG: O-antigen ligase family protein [Planctomycetota bacterium]|nr:O-antigen ligase family protein [Planctomycetota bacterium]